MSFMSAVRVVEYLDSAITAAVELVAVRGCPADEGGHGTGHVTMCTRGPEAASLPQYCVILSFYLLSSRQFLFLIIRLVCFYLNTYERTLQNCRKTLMSWHKKEGGLLNNIFKETLIDFHIYWSTIQKSRHGKCWQTGVRFFETLVFLWSKHLFFAK